MLDLKWPVLAFSGLLVLMWVSENAYYAKNYLVIKTCPLMHWLLDRRYLRLFDIVLCLLIAAVAVISWFEL